MVLLESWPDLWGGTTPCSDPPVSDDPTPSRESLPRCKTCSYWGWNREWGHRCTNERSGAWGRRTNGMYGCIYHSDYDTSKTRSDDEQTNR